MTPYILLDDQLSTDARYYSDPVHILTVHRAKDIHKALRTLERWHEKGYYLAGYIAYEAGFSLEPKLESLAAQANETPLLQFGAFEGFDSRRMLTPRKPADIELNPVWTKSEYLEKFERIQDYINAGDVYQVNLTFPMRGQFSGTARALYEQLRERQQVQYGGIISLGQGPDIISLSPELFFKKLSQKMIMQPMKGTLKRHSDAVIDQRQRGAMRDDDKSRAENLMIVDLLRNDLSRISQAGSVEVPELFTLETYPTLHQMTSTIRSALKPDIDLTQLFKALFPCGSVTGAPKIRAMEIIAELEDEPRGAYCGAMGYIDPNSDSCFNVAIRTLTLSHDQLTYNVGSGIVSDSGGEAEYEECLLKAKAVRGTPRPMLIETLRMTADGGIPREARHLNRLSRSAAALGYSFNPDDWQKALRRLKPAAGHGRVRVTLSAEGELLAAYRPLTQMAAPLKIVISKNPLSLSVQETRFKTSARAFYEQERMRVKTAYGADEVLFVNEDGYLCEGSFTSVFVETETGLKTPDLRCGLLPGVLREDMIASGEAKPAFLTSDDVMSGTFFMGNSLRGLMPAQLITREKI